MPAKPFDKEKDEDEEEDEEDEDEEDEDEGKISENLFEQMLQEAVEDFFRDRRVFVNTFKDCGLLTYNRGIVVEIDDEEFQVTIVKSRG